LILLHSRDGRRVWGRNRDAKLDKFILCVARERRKRIILYDPAVIPRGDFIVLALFIDLSEHPVGLIRLAVERIAIRQFEQTSP